ncbi:MAG: Gfo/Idh/MocA family oxidoreductase [Phycisphaerae bacterium]|nr:Gfo/Idh/MocA family oxidoreductase [Phycisphaerae bacterium]
MSADAITRRGFLASASAGAAILGTGTLAAHAAVGANERLAIGMIGTGDRGQYLTGEILKLSKQHNAEIIAVCDVWKPNLDKCAARVNDHFGREPRKFTRFQDLLEVNDLDAVVVATPDFGHAPIMIAALKAGKDVYVEKPMSINLAEANEALNLARQHERVVQVGTQRRSEGRFKAAGREFATGILGKLNRISAAMFVNAPRWARGFDDCKPGDVDWDAFLFNRPKVPFDPRFLRRWHLYKLCTNGLSGLWMAHYSDAVHMITGSTYPASAVAHGGVYVWEDGREHDDTFQTLIEYPEGYLMSWAMGLGNSLGVHFTLHGTAGTMDLEKWTISGAGGADPKKIEERKIASDPNESHMGNWLECIRSRKRPNADIQYGHQHSVATILAADARYAGTRMVYDPANRTIRPG